MDGIICVYKPQNFTSFDVVAVMRKLFKTRKVGHGGTLDPMAEGVLPIFLGAATRAVDFQTDNNKEYLAGFKFGTTTNTQDITGEITSVSDKIISRDELILTRRYVGEIEQIPPMFSAVQVGGKRLYELARKGIEVERKPRKATIHSIKIEDYADNVGIMRVSCSKGTYIRTLIHDIGQEFGAGAVMTSLTRTKSGVFTLDDCHKLEDLREAPAEKLRSFLKSTDELFMNYPSAKLDETQTNLFKNGAELDAVRIHTERLYDGVYRLYSYEKKLLALARISDENSLKIIQRFKVVADDEK